jgi:hypothetical protein
VVNTTDIPFSDHEMSLMLKGPKYNLHNKPKNWIQNSTGNRNRHLPPPTYRQRRLQKTSRRTHKHSSKEQQPPPTHSTHQEARLIKGIKTKLKENNAMITRADKGNSLVILSIEQYDSKLADFIRTNDFQTTKKDPTKSFQTQIRRLLKDGKNLIPPETK